MKGELRTYCIALCLLSTFLTAHSWRCRFVPEYATCNDEHVKFFLYTRNSGQEEQISIDDVKEKLRDSHYDPALPTKLLLPGQSEKGEKELMENLKDEYLKKGMANVFLVDYSELAPRFCYTTSVFNLRYVGKCVAKFIQGLRDAGKENKVLDLHVIGYRLGGHVPASVAPHLEPYKIPRITGLDPSFPFSRFKRYTRSLKSENAEFVDVVHTGGLLRDNFWPLGHVDVYVNGGAHLQPGCRKGWWIKDLVLANTCSHQRALVYFTESINSSTGFYGFECESRLRAFWNLCSEKSPVLIGDSVNTSLRGMFYVGTKSEAPFAMGNVDHIA